MKRTQRNLIPDCPNPSPDYYCTWQTQLYATSDGKPEAQRRILGEKALFGEEFPFGWSAFYENARRDLLFIMDDSWDVPQDGDSTRYGSLLLDSGKFPEATRGNVPNREALGRLVERMRALGWKGLGGWICAKEAPHSLTDEAEIRRYWTARLADANASDFAYWKVDWGKRAGDAEFRRLLTDLGRQFAPRLTVEHAITPAVLPYSDVYRTYDVPAILSIPMTLRKLKELLPGSRAAAGYAGLLNCEDEAYIAAAGGFTMGIMRHPMAGTLPDGRADMSFPALHRNLKTKQQEITRAVRWHRIAPAFGVGTGKVCIDSAELCDNWRFENSAAEIEEWWLTNPLLGGVRENVCSVSAPARISRGCDLPTVAPDESGRVPFAVAARNPNGACSVATLGRTEGRSYGIPRCEVTLDIGNARTVAAFGDYRNLILRGEIPDGCTVLMQDLAGETAYDITDTVLRTVDRLVIPGQCVREIGTEAQPANDTSEPGVVIRIEEN